MLHRLPSVLVRPGRERLSDIVEVDETYMGGVEPGLRGGRSKGKKSLVVIAIERKDPRGFGRCRMAPIPDFSADTLHRFLIDHVGEGTTVITDGLQSYRPATKDDYVHERHVVPREEADSLLPGVHRVASLAKRWLLGTHQGAVEPDHLAEYLNEFVFRFKVQPRRRGDPAGGEGHRSRASLGTVEACPTMGANRTPPLRLWRSQAQDPARSAHSAGTAIGSADQTVAGQACRRSKQAGLEGGPKLGGIGGQPSPAGCVLSLPRLDPDEVRDHRPAASGWRKQGQCKAPAQA